MDSFFQNFKEDGVRGYFVQHVTDIFWIYLTLIPFIIPNIFKFGIIRVIDVLNTSPGSMNLVVRELLSLVMIYYFIFQVQLCPENVIEHC